MVLGAGWAGARAMTSTSSPGISLMGEFAGLAYYAEVPGVVWDIQRVGPSTGLPTRTAQGDLLSTAVLSHGDTKQIMLMPATVEECYSMAMDAFDLAERFQSIVFVMSDLDLGMNTVDVVDVSVSRPAARSRQAARRRDAQADRRVGQGIRMSTVMASLSNRSRRIDAGVFHPRFGPQRESAVQRTPRRLRGEHGASGAQVRDGAQARPEAGRRGCGRRRDRAIGFGSSHFAIDESRDQLRARPASRPATSGCARIRSPTS